ncbi:MAG TPA: VOC family protein [Nocardioidaceae bacterium]|nr:VOC family protein [Nocardioidaceae bacterium]
MTVASRLEGIPMDVRSLHVMLDLPAETADAASLFWATALGWPLGEPWPGHPEFQSFSPPAGDSYVARQLIDSGSAGIHVDVAVDDVSEVAAHMELLGATRGPVMPYWQVMRSPGGLPYCVVPHRDSTPPEASVWPDDGGHRSRLVQICIDSPPSRHDAEVAFWRSATHWTWSESTGAEFAGKLRPGPGSPVQLLFQRLGDEAPATRAHIDLGTDDVEEETARLANAGASLLRRGDGWIALADPAGLAFCVTANSP